MEVSDSQFAQLKADTLELIEKHQAVQKAYPCDSAEWNEASERLQPLFKAMASLSEFD